LDQLLKKRSGKSGRRRPADAEFVLEHVQREFAKKKTQMGAKKAAAALKVGVASFYNYVNGTTIPDIDVLRQAKKVWKIRWPKLMDPEDVLPRPKAQTPEQYVLSFLDALGKDDVQVVEIGPKGYKTLQVTLNIRFSA
jgi:hypothetical protein